VYRQQRPREKDIVGKNHNRGETKKPTEAEIYYLQYNNRTIIGLVGFVGNLLKRPQYFTALCLIVIIVCNEANDNRTKIVLSKELSLLEGRIRIDN
jgi:hypothetical protein